MHTHELLLKIMAVLAKVSTLREQLPSVLVDLSLYYCCTVHQTLATLRSLCTEGCVRTARSTCVGVCNVYTWTAVTLLCTQLRTHCFEAYCTLGKVYTQQKLRIIAWAAYAEFTQSLVFFPSFFFRLKKDFNG